jgi:SAM-dependent methyltransferase
MNGIVNIHKRVYRSENGEGGAEISYRGTVLYRFMDRLYLSCESEFLEEDEVAALCRERANQPALISPVNAKVKDAFRQLIYAMAPGRILEVGSGSNPILSNQDASERNISYHTSDADPANSPTQFSCSCSKLAFADDYFDLVGAVFVLHFRFAEDQIREISRCLAPSGVFIANVYRRGDSSKESLALAFASSGLCLVRLPDPQDLCINHEYWVASPNIETATKTSQLLANLLAQRIP